MGMTPSLAGEIREKQSKIVKHPEFYLWRFNRINSALSQLAGIHSWWMENPQDRTKLLKCEGAECEEVQKRVKENIGRISNAWGMLLSTRDFINDGIVLKVGAMIDPDSNYGFYRNSDVRLQGLKYSPPDQSKVRRLMNDHIYHLRNYPGEEVDKAVFAHLGIAGIQPLNDGNKRTGRLLQDRILYEAKLPPALIEVGERQAYLDLLDDALLDWSGQEKTGRQRVFYDYVGGKVNAALDQILRDVCNHTHVSTFRHGNGLRH